MMTPTPDTVVAWAWAAVIALGCLCLAIICIGVTVTVVRGFVDAWRAKRVATPAVTSLDLGESPPLRMIGKKPLPPA